MRARTRLILSTSMAVAVVSALAACAHDERRPAANVKGADPRAVASHATGPQQYIVADPGQRTSVIAISLGPSGGIGIVVERARVLAARGEPKVGVDSPDAAISGASRVPPRLGGGFLFWTENTLYRADTFDGPLKPLARVPDAVQNVSFAPKYLLVRTRNGERWALSLPSGERATISPLGVADVEGLEDGRALAFNDQGAVFSSTDAGAHWTDVTSQVKTSPARVAVVEDELWLFESGGGAHRLEGDGQLSYFDKQPVEKPVEIRPRDPRWHGMDSPLREAFRGGAAIDDGTALVVSDGDLVRVDTHTGDILSVQAGKVPTDATCDAVSVSGDVLFVCMSRQSKGGHQAEAFVVSHTLSEDPIIEQTFPGAGMFYASDDGGLVFAGACTGSAAPPSPYGSAPPSTNACVRQPGGSWQEVDVSSVFGDAGPTDVGIARWVPRADGRVTAVIVDPQPSLYDPRSGTHTALSNDARSHIAGGQPNFLPHFKKRYYAPGGSGLDTSWSYTASGSLRGWSRNSIVEITDDGRLVKSPYAFEIAASGPNGLGRTVDGRLFQSTDHGASWAEVAPPPTGTASLDLRTCSSAGCDVGGFYRVGWTAKPPRAEAPPAVARPAPDVRRAKGIELACRPAGVAQQKAQPRTDRSPEDLGLGQSKLPVTNDDRSDIGYFRAAYPRGIANPLHETGTPDDTPALRAVLSGYQTTRDSDVITVLGPNKSASALRRQVAFVPPFDPGASIKRVAIAMSDILTAGRIAGFTTDEILQDDMTETGTMVPLTSHDPNAPGDLVFHNVRGMVALLRTGSDRVRVGVRQVQNEPNVISGVTLSGDEAAFLELESSGVGHVFKLTPSGIVDLFDVNPTMNDTMFYPANPDALAVGPKGDLAILRTASGSDPASAWDPALLLVPSSPPVALAPWSTLRLADDPQCKAEAGWRATVQVITPWVKITSAELRVDESSPMIARVKWNERRVCLEGLEVRLPGVSLRARRDGGSESVTVSSWLVSRGGTFARVGVGEGVEWRQALECSIVTPQSAAAAP